MFLRSPSLAGSSFYETESLPDLNSRGTSHTDSSSCRNMLNQNSYKVDLPTDNMSSPPKLKFSFGKLHQEKTWAKSALNQENVRTHFYDKLFTSSFRTHLGTLTADVSDAFFTSVISRLFSTFTALAIWAAMFFEILRASVLTSQNFSGIYCTITSQTATVPYVAYAVQLQSVKNLNATIWNMNENALNFMNTAMATYSKAFNESCYASNEASKNSTESMARWSNTSLLNLWDTTQSLNATLEKIEQSLETSGISTTSSEPYPLSAYTSIPWDYNVSNCSMPINSSLTNIAMASVKNSVFLAQDSLHNLSTKQVPFIDTKSVRSCGREFGDLIQKLRTRAIAWILTFSILAFLCICSSIFIAFTRGTDSADIEAWLSSSVQNLLQAVSEYPAAARVVGECKKCSNSALTKLLNLALVLLFAGISSASMLSIGLKSTYLDGVEGDLNWTTQVKQIYSQYQTLWNDQSYHLSGTSIGHLDSTYRAFHYNLSQIAGFNLTMDPPFKNGVALAHIDLPVAKSDINAVVKRLGITMNKNFMFLTLESIATSLWIVGTVMVCIWLFYLVMIAAFAIHKSRRDVSAS